VFNRPGSIDAAATELTAVSADGLLIRRAREGDVAAFDRLVADRLDRCYRLAWSILLNEADAADATQDALLAAWSQLPRLRDPAAFDGWLNRIVANAARMARRRRGRLREIPVVGSADAEHGGATPQISTPDPSGGRDLERLEHRDSIGRAFDRLRADQRAILALHYVDGDTVAQIGRALGIPTGTAKWRLHAARRALERAMEAEA